MIRLNRPCSDPTGLFFMIARAIVEGIPRQNGAAAISLVCPEALASGCPWAQPVFMLHHSPCARLPGYRTRAVDRGRRWGAAHLGETSLKPPVACRSCFIAAPIGLRGVAFVGLDAGCHERWGRPLYRMPERCQRPCSVMRFAARFHADQAG